MLAIVPGTSLTLRDAERRRARSPPCRGACSRWSTAGARAGGNYDQSGRRRSTSTAPRKWPPRRAPAHRAPQRAGDEAIARARIARAISRIHVKHDGK
ncbi:MAG: hypothetical protein ACLRSD_08805 [Oscillibacter sp.]